MVFKTNDINLLYDNPLKKAGQESNHDSIEAEHFDAEADRFLSETEEKTLLVDFDEEMPPRHRAFWITIGNPKGLKVLDVGCGYGYSASRLALCGADVTAIDVSPKMCELTRKSAMLNGVDIDVRCISASDTGFEDNYFDLIVGQVSLHHLSLDSAGIELRRILKPCGRAIFLEPIQAGKNLFKLRTMLPLSCKESPGGGALRKDEIDKLSRIFGKVEFRRFAILERLRRIKLFDTISPVLYSIDRFLLAIPGVRNLSAHALIILTKTQTTAN